MESLEWAVDEFKNLGWGLHYLESGGLPEHVEAFLSENPVDQITTNACYIVVPYEVDPMVRLLKFNYALNTEQNLTYKEKEEPSPVHIIQFNEEFVLLMDEFSQGQIPISYDALAWDFCSDRFSRYIQPSGIIMSKYYQIQN